MKKKIIKFGLLTAGIVLVVDAFVLFAYQKINFGTVVPCFIGMVFLVHAIKWQWIQRLLENDIIKLLWQGLWSLFFVWLSTFALFCMYLKVQINKQPALTDVSALIVLGAGVNGDKPTPTLASRLDKASNVLKQNKHITAVMTGGIGFNRDKSEADVMANYLSQHHGINDKNILKEERSTSTEENLLFAKDKLQSQGIGLDQPIAIVTNDFHIVRAKAIARKQGYKKVTMVASHTPLSIRYNAWFREYFAFASGWLLGEY